MNLLLSRDTDNGVCTLGVMHIGDLHWQSLERPWVPDPGGHPGGQQGVSCVPPGIYDLVLHDSEAHPRTWALVNPTLGVTHWGPSQRSLVLIHVANWPRELRGCIALGTSRGPNSVLNSVKAIDEFKAALPWVNGHTLEIKGP